MSSSLTRETRPIAGVDEPPRPSEVVLNNLQSLREAAHMLLREVESLTSSRPPDLDHKLGLQQEVQRYEIELIREALLRTRGNQRRAAKLLGVKVTTLNCKINRFGISITDYSDLSVVA
jgi:transcriptional regulator with PAS, ATPase and Fis domain